MWGDPERAIRLDGSDALVSLLLQITGPAHIPWQDPVWQELLHGYNVWVHVQVDGNNHRSGNVAANGSANGGYSGRSDGILTRACAMIVQHSARTSNLAALSMHVCRLLRECTPSSSATATNGTNNNNNFSGSFQTHNNNHHQSHTSFHEQQLDDPVLAFSNRISLVAKARAASGALNLLRILVHALLPNDDESTATDGTTSHNCNGGSDGTPDHSLYRSPLARRRSRGRSSISATATTPHDRLRDSLSYANRDDGSTKDVGDELLDTLLSFLCHVQLLDDVPELYDAVTLSLQLLTVLLSTQLYQPMQSSFQRQQESSQSTRTPTTNPYSFWQLLSLQASSSSNSNLDDNHLHRSMVSWTPRALSRALLEWYTARPRAPAKSIQSHSCALVEQVVQAKGEVVGVDGLYESHLIVRATISKTSVGSKGSNLNGSSADVLAEASERSGSVGLQRRPSNGALIDATRGVFELSSKLILLPFRLMSLALGLWGLQQLQEGTGYDQAFRQHLRKHGGSRKSRTRDVLWLSSSPVADLSAGVLLLLTNNERAEHNQIRNAFRMELADLADNRWEIDGNDLPDLPEQGFGLSLNSLDVSLNQSIRSEDFTSLMSPSPIARKPVRRVESAPTQLLVNFEELFEAFGATVHTEPGALLFYTLLQASPTFASAIAVRSDLDTLILPLLRTFYFATSTRYHVASQQDYHSSARRSSTHTNSGNSMQQSASGVDSSDTSAFSIRDCPFRSQSQLYVIIILLLLFSQDASFGTDAFRRCMVSSVSWYKERNLKEISLGSVVVLSLLRCLTFTLNRQNDAFLLSNCCAVLMNLSPSIVDLHDYAAMRLVSLTVSATKRYLSLVKKNPNNNEDDLSTPTSMHGEASRTLLCVLKHCLNAKTIDKNLHLVYALVYHQTDFNRIFSSGHPFKKSEISLIQTVLATASQIIEEDGSARTASKALKILSDNIRTVTEAVTERRKRREPEDFTFTYEEEADPEIFFAPYVWEVIVCVVTSATIEWHKNAIRVFPLLEEEPEEEFDDPMNGEHERLIPQFAQDVSDVV